MSEPQSACPGCGLVLPLHTGPTHAYIGASPACWALYGQILAREFGEWAYPPVHRLTVDAYAAQHPGAPSPQSIQSVAVHLIALHLSLECGLPPERIVKALRRALTHKAHFTWLSPPPAPPWLTLLHVRPAADLPEHTARVHQWALSVWTAWTPHHPTIRTWAKR